ncbi:hypothetical protein BCR34DRAFT_593245 [Clohesyomyces aquaticus]|uniref:Uncharacterized protein n=1 Tax=Clohesyomyces aquaticus TaxID=1231657 RepID=A0A1Y1YKH1_9PLEO|nr:hypothetical protein BCR34DRAFT_593245 [Clohesyomyces aquaticus]
MAETTRQQKGCWSWDSGRGEWYIWFDNRPVYQSECYPQDSYYAKPPASHEKTTKYPYALPRGGPALPLQHLPQVTSSSQLNSKGQLHGMPQTYPPPPPPEYRPLHSGDSDEDRQRDEQKRSSTGKNDQEDGSEEKQAVSVPNGYYLASDGRLYPYQLQQENSPWKVNSHSYNTGESDQGIKKEDTQTYLASDGRYYPLPIRT